MSWSSIWAVVALLFTSIIAVIAIYREKPDDNAEQLLLKRRAKPILYALTGLALFAGVSQIWRTDRENQNNEKKRSQERETDKQQIAGLQQSVGTLKESNQSQYDRNLAELHTLQKQLNDIKIDKASEELRKKIAALEAQLDKSMAPKPKAKLDFSFYENNMKIGEIHKSKYIPVEGEVVPFSFVVENNSPVSATGVSVWVRICLECKFHREPPGSRKVPGAQEFEREYSGIDVPAGVAYQKMDVEIELPRRFNRLPVSFDYRCNECETTGEWQELEVSLGRMPVPGFSTATSAAVSKRTKKP
jgi:hypothetical protein